MTMPSMDDQFDLAAACESDRRYQDATDAEFIPDEDAFAKSYAFAAHRSARHLHAALQEISQLRSQHAALSFAVERIAATLGVPRIVESALVSMDLNAALTRHGDGRRFDETAASPRETVIAAFSEPTDWWEYATLEQAADCAVRALRAAGLLDETSSLMEDAYGPDAVRLRAAIAKIEAERDEAHNVLLPTGAPDGHMVTVGTYMDLRDEMNSVWEALGISGDGRNARYSAAHEVTSIREVLAEVQEARDAYRADAELHKEDYLSACQTIAAMHKAAMGKQQGPIRGVVEDVEDLYTRSNAAFLAAEIAWGLIANAGEGDWTKETAEWQKAAARWRDKQWHQLLRDHADAHRDDLEEDSGVVVEPKVLGQVISVRLPSDLAARLRDYAEAEDRTVSDVIRDLITNLLAGHQDA